MQRPGQILLMYMLWCAEAAETKPPLNSALDAYQTTPEDAAFMQLGRRTAGRESGDMACGTATERYVQGMQVAYAALEPQLAPIDCTSDTGITTWMSTGLLKYVFVLVAQRAMTNTLQRNDTKVNDIFYASLGASDIWEVEIAEQKKALGAPICESLAYRANESVAATTSATADAWIMVLEYTATKETSTSAKQRFNRILCVSASQEVLFDSLGMSKMWFTYPTSEYNRKYLASEEIRRFNAVLKNATTAGCSYNINMVEQGVWNVLSTDLYDFAFGASGGEQCRHERLIERGKEVWQRSLAYKPVVEDLIRDMLAMGNLGISDLQSIITEFVDMGMVRLGKAGEQQISWPDEVGSVDDVVGSIEALLARLITGVVCPKLILPLVPSKYEGTQEVMDHVIQEFEQVGKSALPFSQDVAQEFRDFMNDVISV